MLLLSVSVLTTDFSGTVLKSTKKHLPRTWRDVCSTLSTTASPLKGMVVSTITPQTVFWEAWTVKGVTHG